MGSSQWNVINANGIIFIKWRHNVIIVVVKYHGGSEMAPLQNTLAALHYRL